MKDLQVLAGKVFQRHFFVPKFYFLIVTELHVPGKGASLQCFFDLGEERCRCQVSVFSGLTRPPTSSFHSCEKR